MGLFSSHTEIKMSMMVQQCWEFPCWLLVRRPFCPAHLHSFPRPSLFQPPHSPPSAAAAPPQSPPSSQHTSTARYHWLECDLYSRNNSRSNYYSCSMALLYCFYFVGMLPCSSFCSCFAFDVCWIVGWGFDCCRLLVSSCWRKRQLLLVGDRRHRGRMARGRRHSLP